MSKSKHLLSFSGQAITLPGLKPTVVAEIFFGVKTICFASLIICLFSLLSCAGSTQEENKPLVSAAASDAKNELEGAWELVWSKTNGVIDKKQLPMQIKLFSDGFFCLLMQDSSGKWNTASAGTYETEGNIYRETHLYSTEPNWVGNTDFQEYEIKGDTLYKKLFTKVTNSKGEDVTAQYPKIEEKRVKAKK